MWSELFDWYFEFSKNLFNDKDKKIETQTVLKSIFLESLKLLNPAMPHITEEIWSSFNENYIIDNSWPTKYQQESVDIFEIDNLKEIITKIRNFKSTYNLKNSLSIDLYPASSYPDWFINQLEKTANVIISTFEIKSHSFKILLKIKSSSSKILETPVRIFFVLLEIV